MNYRRGNYGRGGNYQSSFSSKQIPQPPPSEVIIDLSVKMMLPVVLESGKKYVIKSGTFSFSSFEKITELFLLKNVHDVSVQIENTLEIPPSVTLHPQFSLFRITQSKNIVLFGGGGSSNEGNIYGLNVFGKHHVNVGDGCEKIIVEKLTFHNFVCSALHFELAKDIVVENCTFSSSLIAEHSLNAIDYNRAKRWKIWIDVSQSEKQVITSSVLSNATNSEIGGASQEPSKTATNLQRIKAIAQASSIPDLPTPSSLPEPPRSHQLCSVSCVSGFDCMNLKVMNCTILDLISHPLSVSGVLCSSKDGGEEESITTDIDGVVIPFQVIKHPSFAVLQEAYQKLVKRSDFQSSAFSIYSPLNMDAGGTGPKFVHQIDAYTRPMLGMCGVVLLGCDHSVVSNISVESMSNVSDSVPGETDAQNNSDHTRDTFGCYISHCNNLVVQNVTITSLRSRMGSCGGVKILNSGNVSVEGVIIKEAVAGELFFETDKTKYNANLHLHSKIMTPSLSCVNITDVQNVTVKKIHLEKATSVSKPVLFSLDSTHSSPVITIS